MEMSSKSVKHEVPIKQYLRSILEISGDLLFKVGSDVKLINSVDSTDNVQR